MVERVFEKYKVGLGFKSPFGHIKRIADDPIRTQYLLFLFIFNIQLKNLSNLYKCTVYLS